MRDSGETFFKPDHPALSAMKSNQLNDYMSGSHSPGKQRAGHKGGALSQMVAAGNMFRNQQNQNEEIKEIQIENEQLKAMIEIMKAEME